jgi:hypothetical protein
MNKSETIEKVAGTFAVMTPEEALRIGEVASNASPEENVEGWIVAIRRVAVQLDHPAPTEEQLGRLLIEMAEHMEACATALRKRAVRCKLRLVGDEAPKKGG